MKSAYSDWLKLEQGVPQGTVLGPLLFNLYVNDMIEILDKTCTLEQYADDTTLLSFHSNPNSATQLFEGSFDRILSFFLSQPINDKCRQNSVHQYLCSITKETQRKLQAASGKEQSQII